ncbi:galactose oxidase [Polyplosphaeria fusca]|uniref:Galactose oxidase n=1 Tax=Polyplosphaeria fusca TaxID=682080 RepID=A0A9P4QNC4_9PLEO|nr:galactose oxidase [Polyplosphaeria fusca]
MRPISLLTWSIGLPAALAESWTVLASIPTGTLREHTTVALGSQVITLGGVVTGGATTKMVQVYDTTSNKWTRFADLPVPINHGNVAVVDGKIWLLGGLTSTSAAYTWKATTTAAVYDPTNGTWIPLEGLSTALARGASAVGVYNGTIYVAGGKAGTGAKSVDTVSAFDVASRKWLTSLPAAASRIPGARDHVGGAVVGHKFYVVGGRDTDTSNVKDTVFILDFEDLDAGWKTSAIKVPTARGGLATAAVGGKIYTFGGEGNQAAGSQGIFKESEVYDVAADSWAKLGPMSKPRHGTFAAEVGGKIYLPGGGTTNGLNSDVAYLDAYEP